MIFIDAVTRKQASACPAAIYKMATATMKFCSLCCSSNPARRRLLTDAKCNNVSNIVEDLLKLKSQRLGGTVADEMSSLLLKGFVCYSCYKVLETFHAKRENLMKKLSKVFDKLDAIDSQSQDQPDVSLHARIPQKRGLGKQSAHNKRRKIQEGKYPEVVVSTKINFSVLYTSFSILITPIHADEVEVWHE